MFDQISFHKYFKDFTTYLEDHCSQIQHQLTIYRSAVSTASSYSSTAVSTNIYVL